MNSGVLKTLELDTILNVLGSFTSTPFGADEALGLRPSTDLDAVRRSQRETTEACRMLAERKEVSLAETPDVRPCLETLEVQRRALDAASLADLAVFARRVDSAKTALRGLHPELVILRDLGAQLPDLSPLRGVVEKAIDIESKGVKDNASPELRSLRARIFKLKNRLRSILESYLRQKDSRKILQDQIITERNGRSVLPVRSECRGQLVGIVHGTSSSGATLFIEPLSTVEINNDIVALEEQERQEVERILFALTEEARAYASELERAVELISHLDLIEAKARLSEAYGGSEPRIEAGKDLRFVSARHPLLIGSITERAGLPPPPREAVPISLRVSAEKNALVITGPNTGGKTVALKTAGLLSLMAQAGLHVPADANSVFPVFRQIFADIGDEQSIGSSLSTFSAHLHHIVEMEQNLEEPALVLLDEVGTGTDPAEGGALGTALVEHFRHRGALVLASTHHGMLKSYASTTPGVGSASFQFDPETYEPLYHLVEGTTGRSLALEIALRLGLPAMIVEHARKLQNEKERQVEDMIRGLEAEGKRLSAEREKLERERRTLEDNLRRHRDRARELARVHEEELEAFKSQLRDQTEQVRRELRGILESARSRSSEAAAPGREALSRLEAEVERNMDAIELKWCPPEPQTSGSPLEVCPGDRVTISSLGLTGIVVAILGHGEVEVMVRDKKLRIAARDLQAAGGRTTPSAEPSSARTRLPAPKHVPHELNVIGCTVDEALSQADKFLDDAFLSDHRTVRLIHGLGKGRLRSAIHQWLEGHPHVMSHQWDQRGAVTVVELKE